jgi:succinyl-CoA synthetase beta subunit
MLLLEHHGKALLRRYGIPTPNSVAVADEAELEAAIGALAGGRLVLKAQVQAGGRGKAGGIVFADTPAEARSAFHKLHGLTVHGMPAQAILVEECVDYLRERFIALSVDEGELRLLVGRAGGVDVEDAAVADPSSLTQITLGPLTGPQPSEIAACLRILGVDEAYHAAYYAIARAIFDLAQTSDALLVEVNPLVEMASGQLIALDAKIAIDEAAISRQPDIAALPGYEAHRADAVETGVSLKFKQNPRAGGSIGLIGLGGGLNLTLMDWIESRGGRVATLVDIDPAIGAGKSREGFHAALATFREDPAIRAVLINAVTCGYRLDDIVAGLLEALATDARSERELPLVLHLRGNSMARTPQLLAEAGRINSASITQAINAVVAAAGG